MLQTETIDGTIGQIESLYRTLTGREAPPVGEQPYATMPPERSPEEHVEEQLDRLAECLADFSGRSSPLARWTPPIAVWQGANELLICIDLPGVPREAVKVRASHGLLEVSGERTARPADGSGQASLLYSEQARGTFRRVVPLPPEAVVDELQAHLREGVLEIRMPRVAAPGGTKTIHVS